MNGGHGPGWPRATIDTVCSELVDCVNRTAPVVDGPTPYKMIRTTNVKNGFIDLSEVRYVTKEIYDRWTRRQVPQIGDVILTREAPLGEVARVRTNDLIFLGQRLFSYRADPGVMDGGFLFYSMRGPDIQSQIKALGAGATVEHMRLPDAKKLIVSVPPLPIQRRIASILGAYDDLIEVNRRRIAILDEMARRLFDEWCPSGGDASSVLPSDPVSGGTSVRDLVIDTMAGDWGEEDRTPTHDTASIVIRGTDMRRILSGDFSTSPTRFLEARNAKRKALLPYDVLVENSINAKTRSSGTTILITPKIVSILGDVVVGASFCRVMRPRTPEFGAVLHAYMQKLVRTGAMEEFQVVAVNGIANFQSKQFMSRAVVPLGPDQITNLGKKFLPLFDTIYAEQISNLQRQRDLALPRLISGELSVTAAEAVLEAVA